MRFACTAVSSSSCMTIEYCILLWELALSPGIWQLLQISLAPQASHSYARAIHSLLCTTFGALWLIPVYAVSFPLSCVWYQEIAGRAYKVSQQQMAKSSAESPSRQPTAPQQPQVVMVQVAQEVYRVVLFAVFFLQTYAASLLPWLGWPANFLLLSWLNALYSFDYKWSMTKRSLQERTDYFEHHWAYFAGFGSVCTAATMKCSFFSGAAILAMLYPLFILIACESDPAKHYKLVAEEEKTSGRELPRMRLPIFSFATHLTSWIVTHGNVVLRAPEVLWRRRWHLALLAIGVSCLIVATPFVQQ